MRDKARKEQQYKIWVRKNSEYWEDRNYAIEWAKDILANKDKFLILDTETTGLDDAEIVQIGIIDIDGNILLDSLVKPSISIPSEVSEIHKITDDMVVNSPTFPELYFRIKEVLSNKEVIIYNADFDVKILNYCCIFYNLPKLKLAKRTHCAMGEYARYYGEWSNYYDDYKSQPLNGGHNAISDCLACLNLIKKMANSKLYSLRELFEEFYKNNEGV